LRMKRGYIPLVYNLRGFRLSIPLRMKQKMILWIHSTSTHSFNSFEDETKIQYKTDVGVFDFQFLWGWNSLVFSL